ncbi:MAG: hypothetical protein WC862_05015 [Patescibacteria group bacterium]
MFLSFLQFIESLFLQPVSLAVIDLIALFGWIALAAVLLKGGLMLTKRYKEKRYSKNWNFVLLAIDIPQLNVQTPKAVEQLFSHIYSVMEPPAIVYYYRRGFKQYSFSFEIVSIEGYIQFLIRTLDKYRDVVEAAVYAQYPDAEIVEVEDYVHGIPDNYPNDTHEIFAAEYTLIRDQAFPIRTYEEFEHSISKDTVLKDPMGTILESFTRIGAGEQVWSQMVIEPIQEHRWKDDVIKEVKKLMGEKPKKDNKFNILNAVSDFTTASVDEIRRQVLGEVASEGAKPKKDEPYNLNLYLSPGTKTIIESMENKIRKLGFKTKIRLIYAAEKNKYNPAKAVNSFTGAMNQFSIPSSNAILPKYLTATDYFFKEQRKNYRRRILMKAYKKRDIIMGGRRPYVLNIEELATIWHFPMSHVKTPLVQKAAAKQAEPPVGLPVEAGASVFIPEDDKEKKPDNLKQYHTDAGPDYGPGQKFG